MKIVAFAATSSRNSINKKLVTYATSLIDGADVEILDINDYEMPLFSVDREAELGHPDEAKAFLAKIGEADALIISFAEHNGTYTAAYKNLFDWMSRVDRNIFQNKPSVYLATSPGPGAAKNVLATATSAAPHFGAELVGELSIGKFQSVFDDNAGKITDAEIDSQLRDVLSNLT